MGSHAIKVTKAMGGDLLVVTRLGSTHYINAASGATVALAEATQGEGLVLRRTAPAAPSGPVQAMKPPRAPAPRSDLATNP